MSDRYIEPGRSDKMIQETESIRKTCFENFTSDRFSYMSDRILFVSDIMSESF